MLFRGIALALLVAPPVAAAEKPTLALLAASPVPAESRQMVLSISQDWSATTARVRHFERAMGGPWKPAGEAVTASLGRTGLAWGRGLHPEDVVGTRKKEGDGKSPAGIFELRLATGYSKTAPPGSRLPYREATATLRCVDDARSRFYNRLMDEAAVVKDWTSAEAMRRADALYRLVVWVGHNDAPVEPGLGSCIFLHVRSEPTATTAGCTAFDDAVMERVLLFLDPATRPVLVQLPQGTYRTLAAEWALPKP